MNMPKLLPWLARKAGVSDARAEELWAESIRHATAKTGWVGTAEYWRVAVERLIELLDQERFEAVGRGLAPWARFQTRMWVFPMIAWGNANLATARVWARLARNRLSML